MILPHSDFVVSVPPLDKEDYFSRRAPLKGNALEMLRSEYGRIGIAAAPIKRQPKTLFVRLVWVYPEHRKERPLIYYIPFATVSFPVLAQADEHPQPATIQPIRHSKIWPQLIPYFNLEHFKNAWDLFSDAGKAEILTALQAPFNGGHPRTLAYKRRLERLKELRHLWDKPREIAALFQTEGLYSQKMPLGQLEGQVKTLIHNLQPPPVG